MANQLLTHKHCVPCEGGVDPFTHAQIETYLPLIPGWAVSGDIAITREYVFKNFNEAISFVNQVAGIAESEGHHPDINLHGWNKVLLTLTTHAIGGLSENDFIMAAKINGLA